MEPRVDQSQIMAADQVSVTFSHVFFNEKSLILELFSLALLFKNSKRETCSVKENVLH
jgi:hypothetical protein